MCYITMGHQCGVFFEKEPDWSGPIGWQDLTRGWVQLCCCVCWPACGWAFMCLCACATPSWRLHPLLTDSLRVLIFHTPAKLWHTEWLLITTLCLRFMQNHTTKTHENCLNKHTGPCGCRSMWDWAVGFCGSSLNNTDMMCELIWYISGLRYCVLE